jgi:hemoglobin/transferrin/lactoferrin receptor protein
LELNIQFSQALSGHTDITWLECNLTSDDFIDSFTQVTEPFSRIMRLTAHLGLEWKRDDKSWWLGSNLTLSAKADKLSESDEGDTERIPPDGTTSYQLVNIYSGW